MVINNYLLYCKFCWVGIFVHIHHGTGVSICFMCDFAFNYMKFYQQTDLRKWTNSSNICLESWFCVLHHLIGSLNYYEHLLILLSAKYIISQVQDSNSQSYKEDLGPICVIIMQILVINHWSRCYELISKVSLTSEANILLIRFLSDLCAIKGKLRLERKKNIPQ